MKNGEEKKTQGEVKFVQRLNESKTNFHEERKPPTIKPDPGPPSRIQISPPSNKKS